MRELADLQENPAQRFNELEQRPLGKDGDLGLQDKISNRCRAASPPTEVEGP